MNIETLGSKSAPGMRREGAFQINRWLFFLLPLILVAGVPAVEPEPNLGPREITTTEGKIYRAAKVTKIDPDGIVIMHASGTAKVAFVKLPEAVRQEFGYDPAKAADYQRQFEAGQARLNAAADAAQQDAISRQQAEKLVQQQLGEAKWIIGRVVRVQDDGLFLQPPRSFDGKVSGVSVEHQLGVTEAAQQRYAAEKSRLPSTLQQYLAQGGTFFGSVAGKTYIAQNWISSADDYARYFSLEKLFQSEGVLKSLSKVPLIETDEAVYIHTAVRADAVDGEYVSLWIVPDGSFQSPGGQTLRAYRAIGK